MTMSACDGSSRPFVQSVIRITAMPLELWIKMRSTMPMRNPTISEVLSTTLTEANHGALWIGPATLLSS